jgi:phosphohistidine phosphatase
MTIYLVQHGEAVPEQIDPERPLSGHGAEDIERLAGFLAHQGVSVNRVLHSGKTRARQTAEMLATAVLPEGDSEAVEGLKPRDPAAQFARELDRHAGDLLVVSHLPFLSKLAAQMISDRDDPPCLSFTPGTLVSLEPRPEGGWVASLVLPPRALDGRR